MCGDTTQKKCNFRKPKFKLSNDMTPTYFSIEFDEKILIKCRFLAPEITIHSHIHTPKVRYEYLVKILHLWNSAY